MIDFDISATSRVGCIRSNNEDMILVRSEFIRSDTFSTSASTQGADRLLFALADGMGGHNAGEVASEDTLSNLNFFINDLPPNLEINQLTEYLFEWLSSINQIIESKGRENPMLENMGTTLVGILYYGGHIFWMNCGDSRFYRLRGSFLEQISIDHSLNNMTGATKHSNVITNCIGAGCKNSYIDFKEFTDDVEDGDVLILCSDGLNDMVPDTEIRKLLLSGANASELCQAAIDAGGYDNVSVCVLRVHKQED